MAMILLVSFAVSGRGHGALNGVWTLIPTKSDFAGQPVVQTGTVTISDQQGIIIVSRSFVYEGATENFFYRDITDAENGATIHSGKDVKSKTRWDHDVLKVTPLSPAQLRLKVTHSVGTAPCSSASHGRAIALSRSSSSTNNAVQKGVQMKTLTPELSRKSEAKVERQPSAKADSGTAPQNGRLLARCQLTGGRPDLSLRQSATEDLPEIRNWKLSPE